MFLKFDFVIISLKNHNFAKSRKFRSPVLKINAIGAGSGEHQALGDFLLK